MRLSDAFPQFGLGYANAMANTMGYFETQNRHHTGHRPYINNFGSPLLSEFLIESICAHLLILISDKKEIKTTGAVKKILDVYVILMTL